MDDVDTLTSTSLRYINSFKSTKVNIEITDKQLTAWKDTLAKSGIVYDTDDEYRDAMQNLAGFFDVLIQIDLQQKASQDNNDSTPSEYPRDTHKQ